MFTWIIRIIWLALGAFLVLRVVESLTLTDQTATLFSFGEGMPGVDVPFLVVGVFWGILLTFGAFTGSPSSGSRGRPTGPARIAPATIIETELTGTSINDVPQYRVYLDVQPVDDEPFVSSFTQLMAAPEAAAAQPGQMLAVNYRPGAPDRVTLANPETREVEQMMLRWRLSRGLIPEHLVGARTRGISQPASVLAVRPTGARREDQVEIETRLLVTPQDGSPQFEADSTVFIHPMALSHVQVGSPVFAMYEPSRPDLVHMTVQRQEGLA